LQVGLGLPSPGEGDEPRVAGDDAGELVEKLVDTPVALGCQRSDCPGQVLGVVVAQGR
jgi:hypothetical protein